MTSKSSLVRLSTGLPLASRTENATVTRFTSTRMDSCAAHRAHHAGNRTRSTSSFRTSSPHDSSSIDSNRHPWNAKRPQFVSGCLPQFARTDTPFARFSLISDRLIVQSVRRTTYDPIQETRHRDARFGILPTAGRIDAGKNPGASGRAANSPRQYQSEPKHKPQRRPAKNESSGPRPHQEDPH